MFGIEQTPRQMRPLLDTVGGSIHVRERWRFVAPLLKGPVKRHSPVYSYFIPFMLWSDLGVKTLETMLGAAQVMAHRTIRITMAGHAPNVSDRREFVLMGQEKWKRVRSRLRPWQHMLSMTQPWGALVYRDFLGIAPRSCRSPVVERLTSCLPGGPPALTLANPRPTWPILRRRSPGSHTMG